MMDNCNAKRPYKQGAVKNLINGSFFNCPFYRVHFTESKGLYSVHQFDILSIIAARNEQEAKTGSLIQDFETKINDFFDYIQKAPEGERLIVKMKSHVSEAEIYDDFAKLYRRYKALNRQKVGDYFFKEMDDLVDKLCDDFEKHLLGSSSE